MAEQKIEKKLTCSQIKKAAIVQAAMQAFQDKGFKLSQHG